MKNTKNKITIDLNRVKKKEWREPQITQLSMKETKSGSIDANTEGSWWFFSWGPQS